MGKGVKEWAFPRGEESLLSGPVAPGVGELDESAVRRDFDLRMAEAEAAGEDMAALAEAMEPQREAQRRDRETAAAAEEDRIKDAPFRVYLRELTELWTSGEGDTTPGRSELELILCRIEKVRGQERSVICHKESRSPEEAMNEGVPDLEGIAMDYAREVGVFGSYAWKLRGWLKGEPVKQTTIRLNLAQPPGYVAPKPQVEPVPEPKRDPMDELSKTIALMGTLRQALGGNSEGGSAQSVALGNALAKLEASEQFRRELREIEDRHKRELKEIEKEAYERGKADGIRDAKAESERRIWELERDLERAEDATAPAPDMIDKVVNAIGGPQALQGIVGAVLQAANRPKVTPKAGPRPVAPKAPLIPPTAQLNPAPEPVNVQPLHPAPELEEPTPAEVADAQALLEDGAAALRESPEAARPDVGDLITVLEDFAAQGRTVSGPQVARWWAALHTPTIPHESGKRINWLELCEILAPEEEESMDIEGLKRLLVQRLEEGIPASAILEEVKAVVPEGTREDWRRLMRWMPMEAVTGFLKVPEHLEGQAQEVLKGFLEG